ncbi:alpha/beta hydrolase [Salinimonas marina]|uniref:Alpha/beta hydrolase n=1 Tax=Salinimonas marina TaxID=2785918 RepID=A0A7S9HCS0_9ALTE|nr:alpha/beta hydrolase [Salinimonas marina]QPG04771.1 alpha/beta hydrolase [Salinimonas marina]
MNLFLRNNIKIIGDVGPTVILSHGFGCDQTMWRYLTPKLAKDYTLVLYDLVGSGQSDLTMYSYEKYNELDGYAEDLLEIIGEVSPDAPVIFIGHSVSASIGLLASVAHPDKFLCQIMVSPSPCFTNDADYTGGFSKADINELCETIDSNYLGWSSNMAPAIMGAPTQPELGEELSNSFCRTDPDIAQHFARVTFLADHRALLPQCHTPTLILQCTDDFIAPCSVGEFMQATLPQSTLTLIDNVGHCPHMSAPQACYEAIDSYLNNTIVSARSAHDT